MPNIGAAYFWLCLVKGGRELQRHALDDWMEEGQRSLAVMDKHLSKSRFFAGERYTVADVALYAYTHVAHECDFDLTPFPAVRAWLARVKAEPLHVPMDRARAETPPNSSVPNANSLNLQRPQKRTSDSKDQRRNLTLSESPVNLSLTKRHRFAAVPESLRRFPDETRPASPTIMPSVLIRGDASRTGFDGDEAMTRDRIAAIGFQHPIRSRRPLTPRNVAFAELIMTCALVISIVVAATAVGIGIARADMTGRFVSRRPHRHDRDCDVSRIADRRHGRHHRRRHAACGRKAAIRLTRLPEPPDTSYR